MVDKNKKLEEKKSEKDLIKEEFLEYKRSKDKKLRDDLIKKHLYIADILAKKYTGKGIEYDDLYQVASLGLIQAVDRYDVEKGFEFSSFATPTIVGEIKKYFRDKGWVIRVPRRIQELSKKVNIARSSLGQQLQRVPSVKDIAEYLNITEEEVLEAVEAGKVYAPQSLDQTVGNDGDKELSLGDIIGEVDDTFDNVEFKDLVIRTMNEMEELEKQILKLRYFEKKTQIYISKTLKISQMTVSRVEKKIIERFKKNLNLED